MVGERRRAAAVGPGRPGRAHRGGAVRACPRPPLLLLSLCPLSGVPAVTRPAVSTDPPAPARRAECGWDCWRRAPGEVVGRTGGLILAGEPAEKAETLQALLLAARVSGSVEVAAAGAAALAAVWAPLVKEHVFGCVAALTRQQTVGELAAAPASLQVTRHPSLNS